MSGTFQQAATQDRFSVEWNEHEEIARAKRGDSLAQEALYRRFCDRIYRLLLRMVHDPHDAEELLQESFFTAFTHLVTFKGESQFYTWLYAIALRRALQFLKKRQPQCFEPAVLDLLPGDRGVATPLAPVLDRALAQLPPGYRAVLVLYDIEGFDHAEIAQLLGIAVGTSKSQLHKARKMMHDMVKPILSKLRLRSEASQ